MPDAPHEADAVRGITWTGTVSALQERNVDHDGVEHWTITFAVDHVYAHAEDRDFPKAAILAPGVPFTLPYAACGPGRGDLGLAVGHPYLVRAEFIADNGISLGNLAIWEIEGDGVALVPGPYQTSFVSAEISGASTLELGSHSGRGHASPVISPQDDEVRSFAPHRDAPFGRLGG